MSSLLFPYELPEHKIAQRPAPAGSSRLLHAVIEPDSKVHIEDSQFAVLDSVLRPGDLLVLNNSKVLPARFFPPALSAGSEVLLLQEISRNPEQDSAVWEVLARPMKRVEKQETFMLSASIRARVLGRSANQKRLLLSLSTSASLTLDEAIESEGSMPIPPYIRNGRADQEDKLRYQTQFASIEGSVAAPTAGLHFTEELFDQLNARGIQSVFVCHHVGPASFLPVRNGQWQDHEMSEEFFQISRQSYEQICRCRANGGRIVAVGTTSVRALESFFGLDEASRIRSADTLLGTKLFITPGYEFQGVDVLITNFHQPLSTHLLLVAAFAGVEATREMYQHALKQNYRFLSYGDGMCIEREGEKRGG